MSANHVMLVIPHHNTGGHFVIWSLLYCSRHDTTTVQRAATDVVSVENFTNQKNFHQQEAYTVTGLEHLQREIEFLHSNPSLPNAVLYLNDRCIDEVVESMFGVTISNARPDQISVAEQFIKSDGRAMLEWIQQENLPLIYLDYTAADLHSRFYNDRFPLFFTQPVDSIDRRWDLFQQTYFAGSELNWSENNIWDRRERMAINLCMDPAPDYYQFVDRKQPHLYYTTDDLWNDLQRVIPEMLKFLDWELDNERFAKWLSVYQKWRLNHDFAFSRNFDQIIDAIINNQFMSLERYNMTFWHEVLIQHCLIHKHNLNLRTWQLEKFPNNTQAIHALLEKNIHII